MGWRELEGNVVEGPREIGGNGDEESGVGVL